MAFRVLHKFALEVSGFVVDLEDISAQILE